MSVEDDDSPGARDALLELIGDVCGLLDIDELRRGLLEAIKRALPSDYVSLNDIGSDAMPLATLMSPETRMDLYEKWEELAHENPILRFYQESGGGQAWRFSDLIGQDELHELALYREVYLPLGVEYQVAFTLPASSERILAIALSRGERDYSDAERDFVNRARPFLIQAYLNAIAFSELRAARPDDVAPPRVSVLLAAGLTRREAEVVRQVALGGSNQHIASALSISSRTVGKHLEHSFRKLGVGDRSSAASRVWELDAAAQAVGSGVVGQAPS
jgi:DNA-binding CsgD family transcriptional regulator